MKSEEGKQLNRELSVEDVEAVTGSLQTDPQRSNENAKNVCVSSFLYNRIAPHEKLIRAMRLYPCLSCDRVVSVYLRIHDSAFYIKAVERKWVPLKTRG